MADGTIVDADISPVARIEASKIVGGDLTAARLKVGTDHILTGVLAPSLADPTIRPRPISP
jgi:hypothetical protein